MAGYPQRWIETAAAVAVALGVTTSAWAQAPADGGEGGAGSESEGAPEGASKGGSSDDGGASEGGGAPGPDKPRVDPADLDWDDDDDDDDDASGGTTELTAEAKAEAREARREQAAQAALEEAEPRPPLAELQTPEPPKWERRLEIGGAFAVVIRPFADGVVPNTGIKYKPAPGWGVVIRWRIWDWIAFHPYFIDSHHRLAIPTGALATDASNSISPDALVETNSVTTFSFGAKLAPTWEIIPRLRVWGAVGVGWGRFDFPTMTLTEGDQRFEVNDREAVFVEFPMGLGISFDVIDKWVAVSYEATAAPITGQSGNAHEPFQAVDGEGDTRDVGPLGAIEASFVQTLAVTVIL